VLLEGTVSLDVHEPGASPIPIEALTVPEVVGWSWLMPPFRWHFDVRAATPVRAIAIEVEALRVAMLDTPSFGFALRPGAPPATPGDPPATGRRAEQ
jgi:hypothetical protein